MIIWPDPEGLFLCGYHCSSSGLIGIPINTDFWILAYIGRHSAADPEPQTFRLLNNVWRTSQWLPQVKRVPCSKIWLTKWKISLPLPSTMPFKLLACHFIRYLLFIQIFCKRKRSWNWNFLRSCCSLAKMKASIWFSANGKGWAHCGHCQLLICNFLALKNFSCEIIKKKN